MIKINSKQKEKVTFKGFFKEEIEQMNQLFLNKSKVGEVSYSDATNSILIYLGEKQKADYIKIYDAIRLFLMNSQQYDLNIDVDSFLFDNSDKPIKAVIEGVLFGEHNKFSLKTKIKIRNVNYNLVTSKNIVKLFENSKKLMEAVNLCRDVNDAPPNVCTPKGFVEKTTNHLKQFENLKITVLSRKECEKLGMGIFLSVGDGAINPSCVMIVEYNGNSTSQEKTAFIGKGITMDTGGYALKPLIGQRNERYDMCGAGTVISAMSGIAQTKPKKNIIGIGAMSENRIGGATTLNSSIIKSMSGQTVEISSTDAEGRLVMADCITYAIKKLHATKIVTVATLTGSAIQALGKPTSAIMTTSESFVVEIFKAANNANESVWKLPIHETNYQQMSISEYADLNNSSWEKYCTAGTAAAFLDFFTEGLPFVHIDIAGSAYINDRSHGTMVKTMIEYANNEN